MARGQQTEKKKKPIKYFDYSLLFLIIFLLCFGLVMLYSTSSYAGSNKFGDASYFVKKQLFATGLGIVGMYIVSKIPYRFWMKVSSKASSQASTSWARNASEGIQLMPVGFWELTAPL
ncbi:MAG: FtsW/RodA/SpoVE family cell cycle protein [Roseburia sp.]|nr:FtsW/RodA/SpoVE family cell cycle protein [Roseburia sp.]